MFVDVVVTVAVFVAVVFVVVVVVDFEALVVLLPQLLLIILGFFLFCFRGGGKKGKEQGDQKKNCLLGKYICNSTLYPALRISCCIFFFNDGKWKLI